MSLITIILFICMPILSVIAIFIAILYDKKHNLIYGILLALLFAIIAYNFVPRETDDLTRYNLEMNAYYAKIDLGRYVQEAFSNTKIIFKALQYICAQIGNLNLLPFICTFVGYSIVFGIILDYSKLKNVNRVISIATMIIFILTFYHINFFSGLAQFLAISVGFLGIYLEFVRKKTKWVYKILYVIPIFIHISTVFILAIRVIMMFKYKNITKLSIIILIVYAFMPNIIYNILTVVPGMSMIAQKINSYMLQGDKILTGLYDYATLGILILYLYIFYSSKKILKEEFNSKFMQFMEIILLLNIFSCVYRDIFSRILTITMLFFNVYFMSYFQKYKKKDILFTILFITIFCVTLGSVNYNNLVNRDYGKIKLENVTQNIFYFFEK